LALTWTRFAKKLDVKQQPQLFKLVKSSIDKYPSTLEDFPRLQLYSVKDGHALQF
jgi:hypothetical protein